MSIRVVLADDHPMIRAGIRAAIEESGRDITVVHEAADGREVLRFVERHAADVYLLDIEMPGLNGLDTAERLLKKDPRAKIVVFSLHGARAFVSRAIRMGVKGYVLKDSACAEVVQAIEAVHRGHVYLSPAVSKFVVEGFLGRGAGPSADGPGPAGAPGASDSPGEPGPEPLTPREREILQLIGEGHTSKEIAERLNLRLNTVQVHRRNLMVKLGLHSHAELIRYAIREGISKL